MKKLLCILFILTGVSCAFSQDSSRTVKTYSNEFGLDATGFITQFVINSQQQFGVPYAPVYYISYRRYFKNGNLRFAIGGDYSTGNMPSGYSNDPRLYTNTRGSFNARVGWEFTAELSNRWQAFYGLDFRPSYFHAKNDYNDTNGGYVEGSESISQIYGLSPLLGFRFRLTNRLSIITEASFAMNMEKDQSRKFYTPLSGAYPPMPDDPTVNTQKIFSNFQQPISVFFVFKI